MVVEKILSVRATHSMSVLSTASMVCQRASMVCRREAFNSIFEVSSMTNASLRYTYIAGVLEHVSIDLAAVYDASAS